MSNPGRTFVVLATALVLPVVPAAAGETHRGHITRGGRGTVRYAGRRAGGVRSAPAAYGMIGHPPAPRPPNYGSVRHSTTHRYRADAVGRDRTAAVAGLDGEAIAAVGPVGGRIVAGRRPYGMAAVARLPDGAERLRIHDHWYYHHSYHWYRRYWRGDDVCYWRIYPPVGFFYSVLPDGYETVDVHGRTRYYADGAYYEAGAKDGQAGYLVADPPAESIADERNPYKILERAGEYLADRERFTVESEHEYDEALESGRMARVFYRAAASVRRPDGLFAETAGDDHNKRFYYDGRTLAILDRDKNVYASAPAPASIDGLLDTMADRYAAVIPVGDLLYANAYEALACEAKQGRYVGSAKVGEHACHHLAFRGEAVDWEIWVQQGDQPLPRKLLLTYKNRPGWPRYGATITGWTLDAPLSDEMFVFTPPLATERIEMLAVRPEPPAAAGADSSSSAAADDSTSPGEAEGRAPAE